MAHAVMQVSEDIVYLSKKHFCPSCNSELKKVKVSKIVNSASEEAKNMPKMFSRTHIGSRGIKLRSYKFIGDVKYIFTEFECETCKRHFTVEEMKKIEGVLPDVTEERSPEEEKRIQRKRFIFNKVVPIVILILIALIRFIVSKT